MARKKGDKPPPPSGTIPLREYRRREADKEREKTAELKGEMQKAFPGAGEIRVTPSAELMMPEYSEDRIALWFSDIHANDLKYVSVWGAWYEWDKFRWRRESTLHAFDLARDLCRQAAFLATRDGKSRAADDLSTSSFHASVERLGRADRRQAATVDQWDRDPWLLNTPGGAIDLRSGRIRPNDPGDFCSKATAVAPGGECPVWIEFLKKISGGDDELIGFLRRMAGYALTGSTAEHALFFGYGTGANGKGVFVKTLAGVMGDYAVTAPMETFVATNHDRHPTELAMLRGARLVTAQETEQGKRWAESKIKALTGGDTITARFMNKDFFEFTPQFKLLIMGNHKPGLNGVDEAIRRRMNLLPFNVTIPEAERDPDLSERLRNEWPGILQWMLDGCAEWQGEGLCQPEAIRLATEAYLTAEDDMGQWLEDRCVVDRHASVLLSDLYAGWKSWADATGASAGSQKSFSMALEDRGFVKGKHEVTRRSLFKGVRLAY